LDSKKRETKVNKHTPFCPAQHTDISFQSYAFKLKSIKSGVLYKFLIAGEMLLFVGSLKYDEVCITINL